MRRNSRFRLVEERLSFVGESRVGLYITSALVHGGAAAVLFAALSTGAHPMSADFPVTIFHNAACGTSRNALALIRAAGYAPTVIDYLEVGWTRPQLEELLAGMAARPRDLLREKGTPAAELGLLDPSVGDGRILDAMVAHPVLVNRPIVVTPKGVKLARPSETVLELLDRQPETFAAEDGEAVTPPRTG
jgi:arsenate reductase